MTLTEAVAEVNRGINKKRNATRWRRTMESKVALSFDEHWAFRTLFTQVRALGHVTEEDASLIDHALGDWHNGENGGWEAGTDLATKIVVWSYFSRHRLDNKVSSR